MRNSVERTVELLGRTPGTLDALLRGAPAELIHATYADDTFSALDVLGHLVEGERHDWLPRIRHTLEHGTDVSFEPFDRYSHFEAHAGRSTDELLDEFASRRAANLDAFVALGLSPADLDRRGLHPAFGAVTIAQLLAAWIAHDLNHIAQVARCLAAPLRDQTGPWRAYMGIYHLPATAMDAEGVRRKAACRDR